MDAHLRQKIDEITRLHGEATTRLRGLAEERHRIEDQRRRILMQFEEPGESNPGVHRALAGLEGDLEDKRRGEQDLRRNMQSAIDALRNDVHNSLRASRELLAEQLHQAQQEADHLRDDLIPEARRYLEALEERYRLAESRCLTLANQLSASGNEVPDLGRFEIL